MSNPGYPLIVYPFRLEPGMELKSELLKFVSENGLKAPFVMTCCGSVTKATIRFAHQKDSHVNEVVSLCIIIKYNYQVNVVIFEQFNLVLRKIVFGNSNLR